MKTVPHYASYVINNQEVYGTAELLNGTGWLFRQDGERTGILVSSTNPELLLLGVVEMADAKLVEDGDRVRKCSRTLVGV